MRTILAIAIGIMIGCTAYAVDALAPKLVSDELTRLGIKNGLVVSFAGQPYELKNITIERRSASTFAVVFTAVPKN